MNMGKAPSLAAIRAFTLIELLIVVAIIAILAAIAVPNFLEAQARSKVARVRADMRAMAVSIEAYRVDGQEYPTNLRPELLTSPVAYIAKLPNDPFSTDDNRQFVRDTFQYNNGRVGRGTNFRANNIVKDYYQQNWPYLSPEWRATGADLPAYLGDPVMEWVLKSYGPDRWDPTCRAKRGDDYSLAYDPSNGVVSHGDICRFGP